MIQTTLQHSGKEQYAHATNYEDERTQGDSDIDDDDDNIFDNGPINMGHMHVRLGLVDDEG